MSLKRFPLLDILRLYKKVTARELEDELGSAFLLLHGYAGADSDGPDLQEFETLVLCIRSLTRFVRTDRA